MKQGYIHLLPYMLRFLAGTRRVVHYHDVTPGSQITWNTAFLAVTGAWLRGGEEEVRNLLRVLESVAGIPEEQLSEELKKERLMLYKESNDAFRDLLLGRFGPLPLGFPPLWVYESAFGDEYEQALSRRTEESPLHALTEMDVEGERNELHRQIEREPTHEELIMYLNHPGDALKTIRFRSEFGNPNRLPLDVWFEGLVQGEELIFTDSGENPHLIKILDIGPVDGVGMRLVRYSLDDETFSHSVKVAEATAIHEKALEMADRKNPWHVAAPSTGDLWVMYVKPGDIVKKGEELFNITIMKQEKAVVAAKDAIVERVLKTANYKQDRQMVSVREGELLVELGPLPRKCVACKTHLMDDSFRFCPECGVAVEAA